MASLTFALVGITATIVLLGCSALFSSTETAMFSLSKEWIEQQGETNDHRGRVLWELHEDPHRLLVTLLVGNNIVNIAIASIVTVVVSMYFPPGFTVVITTVLSSTLILVFGEIVPKAYGLENAQTWALTVAPPVRRVEYVFSPLITLFDGITRRMNALITTNIAIERPYLD